MGRCVTLSVVFIATSICSMDCARCGIIYDLGADWSDTSNPNGVWSYNDGSGALPTNHSDYLPIEFAVDQPAWAHAASGPGHIASWFKSTNNKYDFLVGDIITHTWDHASSGIGTSTSPSQLTWTSPLAGTIDISGSVWLARDIGRAVNWDLAINGTTVSGGSLFDGDAYSRAAQFDLADGSGGASVLDNISILAGQQVTLFFITQTSANSYGEFTGVDFQIDLNPVPEPTSLAIFGIGAICLAGIRRRKKQTA